MSDPTADVAAKVAVSIITEVFKSALHGVKDTKDWLDVQNKKRDIFGFAARKYANKVEKLYNTMRIFGMSNPVPLRGIYTRVNILQKLTSSFQITVEELERRFNSNSGQFRFMQVPIDGITVVNQIEKLVVLGKPGAGKTTFLKYVTLHALDGNLKNRRIPIFVSLKDWSDSGLSLMSYIVQQFDICDFRDAEPFIEGMLKEGKCLLLLDGFDEVTTDVDEAIQQIHNFVNKYDTNQFILSCRVAAYSYCFPRFTDIEVTDFKSEQIETFVNNWFGWGSAKARLCWKKIKEDRAISELASVPLLLTLLCLAFDENMDFPSNRAELYKDAVDALLKKWDASRSIKRAEIYRYLSPRRKESLFSRIAATTFSDEKYFIPQRILEKYITEFISNLPEDKDGRLDFDGEAILKAVEAQHGIFVERAKRIYSFSHLTFQEYFTARYVVENLQKGTLKNLVYKHLTNERWREVFLLVAGMLDEADTFLLLMNERIRELAIQSEVSSLIISCQRSADEQNDLCSLLPDTGKLLAYDRARLLTLALYVSREYLLAHSNWGRLPRHYDPSLAERNSNVLSLCAGLVSDLTNILIKDSDYSGTDSSVLKAQTKILYKPGAVKHAFVDSRAVVERLNQLGKEYSIIGNALALSFLHDLSELSQFLTATKLLVSSLQTECYVSKNVRREIMNELLVAHG